jgi:hypothetical protein
MTVSFQTVIGPDGIIHLPPNIPRPEGNVEVIVTERADSLPPESPSPAESPKRHMFQDLLDVAATIDWSQVPSDLARNHDHYLHGLPKGIDDE